MRACFRRIDSLVLITLLACVTAAPPAAASLRALTDGYVGCNTSDSCAPFDLTTYAPGTAISLLPEGNYPYDATLSPDGSELWIPGASGDGVIVIDRATNTISHRIAVGEYPISVAFSNDWTFALVSCRDTDEVKIVDTATHAVTGSLPISSSYLGPGNIALDPMSGKFYMVDWYGDDLYEIAADGSAVLNQVTLGNSLWQLVVAPNGQKIYVTDRSTDEVRVIEPATLTQVSSYAIGDDPWGIDITADSEKLVVACEDSHNAYVINTNTGLRTPIALDASADPRDVDILDSEGLAYVAGGQTRGNPVYVIELTDDTLKDSFAVGCTNVNVIAVQAQTTRPLIGAGELATVGGRASLFARPNPFGASTRIRYSVGQSSPVRLVVYDVSGRAVRRLANGWRATGSYETSWDGREDGGQRAAAGVYFLRLEAGAERCGQRLVLLK